MGRGRSGRRKKLCIIPDRRLRGLSFQGSLLISKGLGYMPRVLSKGVTWRGEEVAQIRAVVGEMERSG